MSTQTQPVLFLGHGSPMNAITRNPFAKRLESLGKELGSPRAILCVSAHWMTEGTYVTGMKNPRTIHDFHGFPRELSEVKYPAPGSPEVAALVAKVSGAQVDAETWGLDHGTWAVLRHMYPKADIPVLQLSLYMEREPRYHFEMGRKLAALRGEGVLIVGSGNIVHNLRAIRWEEDAPAYDWAIEFDAWVKEKIKARDFDALVDKFHATVAGKLSVPSLDHYLPLLYILGAASTDDTLEFEYEGLENGSISMQSFSFSS